MYSSSYSIINLMQFLSNCSYDAINNTMTARIVRTEKSNVAYRSKRRKAETVEREVKFVNYLTIEVRCLICKTQKCL